MSFTANCGISPWRRAKLPLLLSGESGLGKSAALARFVRDFRKEHPDVFVLPHFVGASPRTTSLAAMLQRLTQELQRRFESDAADSGRVARREIIRTFVVAITSLPESARVVLVFDALNQLDADNRAETLVWLPEQLPANVPGAVQRRHRPAANRRRVLTAFGERQYVSVLLRPLSDDERRAIIKAVPRLVAKTLDDKQIDALLANPATRKPAVPDGRPGRTARLRLVREPEQADRPASAQGRCPDEALRAGIRAAGEGVRPASSVASRSCACWPAPGGA